MKTSFLFIPLILLFSSMRTCSIQAQSIVFNKVTPPEGRNFLHITGIVQDKQGFMWFASKKGLYRYDGYTITYYKNNPLNPNSLGSNALECICIDSSGIIWIGTFGSGLDRFDPATETFTHFHFDSKNKTSLSNDTVWTILQDRHGTIWLGSPGGLDRFNPQNEKFIHYRHQANDTNSISNNIVRTLYEDHQGTFWIGTGSPYPGDGSGPDGGGLNKMDTRTGKFIRYLHDPNNPHSLVNNQVGAIFEDSKGIFWVGTAGDGLHTMNRITGTFERHLYDAANPEKLSRPPLNKTFTYDHITFIKEDATGKIWIGTSDAGINRYDPYTKKVKHFQSNDRININGINEFDDNTSWAAFTSREGILWISTISGNLYRIDPFDRNFPHISLGTAANSLYEEPSGTLLIGTWKGLIRSDSIGNGKRPPTDSMNSAGLTNITRIRGDKQGNIWVGTNKGLYLFDMKKQNFIPYRHDDKNSNSLSDDIIWCIYEDLKSNLWIGTFRGLDQMNRKTGEFKHFKLSSLDTNRFGSNTVSSILEDREGRLWVGSFFAEGIHQLNRKNATFSDYLVGVAIRCIYEDADGILWVGADDGLYQYNESSDVFSRFIDQSSSAGIDDVTSIIEDDQKNLWIGTSIGIIQLNRERNETNLYGKNYKVDGNELTYAAYKGHKGKLYFGTYTGYYAFIPGQLTNNSKPPQIVFSGFRIADQLVKPGKNSLLAEPLSGITKIRLPYNENVFSFDFVAIDYTNSQDNRYLFKLENYDKNWHKAGLDRRAGYFNVPPGKYTFKVKAANSDGLWAEKSIDIIITPPWWRTWWAYCLYGLVMIIGIYLIHRFQKQKIIYKERERTKEKELAQAKEIEKAYNELKSTQTQLIQSEKMASLGELTAGIAHEIQNPLNFVNNFSEVNSDLVDELKTELSTGNMQQAIEIADSIKHNEQKINHHGKRADAIVKGMLQHSRASTGQKEPTDINALADEYLRLSYHGLRAKDKSFNATIQTDFDKSIDKVQVVPQDVGRALLNLINNAFYSVTEKMKRVGDNYEPIVLVSTKKINTSTNGTIVIRVRDNGLGISQKILDKIFQPFFTTKATGKGTGLGLSLSYDIVKAHGGEIKVETKEGEGAEFIIQLPIV